MRMKFRKKKKEMIIIINNNKHQHEQVKVKCGKMQATITIANYMKWITATHTSSTG